jgi:DNA-binding NarL/FixJ family response regulator
VLARRRTSALSSETGDAAGRGGGEGVAVQKTRVLIVEDSADVGEMLRFLINRAGDLVSVGVATTADSLERHAKEFDAHVILMDRLMPGRCPIAALRELTEGNSPSRVIVMSGHDGAEYVDEAMDAGAWGYVCKDRHPEEFLAAIRRVAAGQTSFPNG